MSCLAYFSIFRETRFWRFNGKSKYKNPFGGCVTLLLTLAIGTIFIQQLISVLDKSKPIVSN